MLQQKPQPEASIYCHRLWLDVGKTTREHGKGVTTSTPDFSGKNPQTSVNLYEELTVRNKNINMKIK